MKKLYAVSFAFMLQTTVPVMAQCLTDSLLSLLGTEATYYSYNGSVHTPKDTLHMLVIFRAFNNNTEDWNIGQPDLFWAHDDIPSWAKGASNKLFDSSHHTIGQTLNLSAWFHRMSKGKFIVTGEVFPHLVIQNLKNF